MGRERCTENRNGTSQASDESVRKWSGPAGRPRQARSQIRDERNNRRLSIGVGRQFAREVVNTAVGGWKIPKLSEPGTTGIPCAKTVKYYYATARSRGLASLASRAAFVCLGQDRRGNKKKKKDDSWGGGPLRDKRDQMSKRCGEQTKCSGARRLHVSSVGGGQDGIFGRWLERPTPAWLCHGPTCQG